VNDLSRYLARSENDATNPNAPRARARPLNGVKQANQVLQRNPGIDGYMLKRDAVRQEPELILFAGGLQKLVFQFRAELERVKGPLPPPIDDSAIGSRPVRLVGGGRTLHTLNPTNLSDFRTVGDDRATGRARAQSF
jgi:hypothetical protein